MRTLPILALAALAACTESESEPELSTRYVAFGSSGSTVTVAWAAIDGAVSYTIERGDSDDTLAPIATVDAPARSFLDTGLAPLTPYSYRLTINSAAGSEVEPIAHTRTTDDELLITGDPTPLGPPVVATVGTDGAAIAVDAVGATLVVPAGTVPDGTTVTIQPIASPREDDDDSAGVSLESSVPFAQPVELVFALDEIDALQPDYVALAAHRPDGSWVAQPRTIDADAGTATLVLGPEAGMARASVFAGIRYHEVVRMRSTFVLPARATVKVRETLRLVPFGVFSDDPCEGDADETFCGVTAVLGGLAGIVDLADTQRPARRYARQLANSKPNYERTWLVGVAINGNTTLGTIAPSGAVGATYTAPAAKPPGGTVEVRFASVQLAPARRSVPTVPAKITIEDPGSLRVTADFHITSSDACPAASVEISDRVTFAITRSPDGRLAVEAIGNQPTMIGPLSFPPPLTGGWDIEPEAFTMTSGIAAEAPTSHEISVSVLGNWVVGSCHYVFEGDSVQVPGAPVTGTFGFAVDAMGRLVPNTTTSPFWTVTVESSDP